MSSFVAALSVSVVVAFNSSSFGADAAKGEVRTIHVSELSRRKVVGWLGRPLGEIVVVEGLIADGSYTKMKIDSGETLLRVHAVNGHKLRKEKIFHFHASRWAKVTKPRAGAKFKYVGYETGGFRGIPGGAFKYVPPVATTTHHFGTSFVILRDETSRRR